MIRKADEIAILGHSKKQFLPLKKRKIEVSIIINIWNIKNYTH